MEIVAEKLTTRRANLSSVLHEITSGSELILKAVIIAGTAFGKSRKLISDEIWSHKTRNCDRLNSKKF